MRAGTENVPGIVGIGKAIELAYENFDEYNKKLTNLRDYYISQVEEKIPNTKLNGHKTKRLPGNANISFLGIDGEALLLNLDAKGICASTGSACTSRLTCTITCTCSNRIRTRNSSRVFKSYIWRR